MTEIEEITWETFDERTRIWMQVLSNIPAEAVVRMLRLDLNTGVVTLRGVGGDRVLGVISTDDDTGVGRSFFVPLRSWSKDLPAEPVPYETGYARNIALAVYYAALNVLVGDLPLIWDDTDGLCWVSDQIDEALNVNTTDLCEYRDRIRAEAAECWVAEFVAFLEEDDIPLQVTRETTPTTTRYLTGGRGSVEIAAAPDDTGLIDVNILDPQGRGLCFHLAWGSETVQEAHERAVLFLNHVMRKKERKENHVG